MKQTLILYDAGDREAGIMPQYWEIPLPFEKDDVTEVEHDYFRKKMEEIYQEWSEGRLISWYTWERQENDI
jgi:hypothetical protein